MNLGTVALKSVYPSHPKINRAPSKSSITASDDYYSFSDHASDPSSVKNINQWTTPPSPHQSPEQPERTPIPSEIAVPAKTAIRTSSKITAPLVVRFDEQEMKQQPLAESSSRPKQRTADPRDRGAPTPGVDDTPYIRFAIEQLTRDEEVKALQRPMTASSESVYDVQRIVPDEGLGYYSHGPISITRQTEEVESPMSDRDVYIPVDRPQDSYRHPDLTFVPGILRPFFLVALLLCVLLALAGIVASIVYSKKHDGLWGYTGAKDSRYFLFEFLPTLLAVIIVLVTIPVQSAIYRMTPFISMASTSASKRADAAFMELSIRDFVLPNFSFFRAGQPVLGSCVLAFWLAFFTIPLTSALYQPRYQAGGTWRWLTVQPIAYVLLVLYGLLAISVLVLAVYFFRRHTGLKCDPRTLADLIVLLQRSNSLDAFNGTETMLRPKEFRQRLSLRSNRLGYWKTTSRPYETFYGIGEEGALTRRYSLLRGKLSEKTTFDDDEYDDPYATKAQDPNLVSHALRYRFVPWFLRDTWIVLWAVLAIVLLIAFLVASNLKGALLHGFRPLVSTAPSGSGFSASNFLYSFLPSFLGLVLVVFAWTLDYTFRILQPFANLSSTTGGSDAAHSLLLDYPACLPFKCTIKALANSDYKIGLLSSLSILSLAIPVLAGGMFIAEYRASDDTIYVVVHPTAFYILSAFLVVYAVCICNLWPGRKRYLPHDVSTLAEIISFLYKSPVVQDAAFREVTGRIDLVTRLVTPPKGELGISGGRARWAFGVFPTRGPGGLGLGIERVGRRGGGGVIGMGVGLGRVQGRKETRRYTGDDRQTGRRVTTSVPKKQYA